MNEPRQAVFGRTSPNSASRIKLVDAQGLVALLEKNEHLERALDAYPDSDVVLVSCSVLEHEARVIAKFTGRTVYYPTGDLYTLSAEAVFNAVSDSSALPFSVTDDAAQKFKSSLDNAPRNLAWIHRRYWRRECVVTTEVPFDLGLSELLKLR